MLPGLSRLRINSLDVKLSLDWFTSFMNQSVFQNGRFGASDIPILTLCTPSTFSIGPMKSVKHRDLQLVYTFS